MGHFVTAEGAAAVFVLELGKLAITGGCSGIWGRSLAGSSELSPTSQSFEKGANVYQFNFERRFEKTCADQLLCPSEITRPISSQFVFTLQNPEHPDNNRFVLLQHIHKLRDLERLSFYPHNSKMWKI
jgi:hypothetical protein